MDELIKLDHGFSEDAFKTKADNIMVMYHMAIMTENPERVKHFLADQVYQHMLQQLNDLKKQNRRQMFDELNVKSTDVVSVNITDVAFIIKTSIVMRYLDYQVNRTTNDFISGNREVRKEVPCLVTFVKKRNAKEQGISRKCPNCGANMDINNTGKCPYCGGIYNTEDYDYIVTNIEKR